MAGGLSALGAALAGVGIPRDSVLQYEQALKADGFLVVGHGPPGEMERARTLLQINGPLQIDLHVEAHEPAMIAAQ